MRLARTRKQQGQRRRTPRQPRSRRVAPVEGVENGSDATLRQAAAAASTGSLSPGSETGTAESQPPAGTDPEPKQITHGAGRQETETAWSLACSTPR